MTLKKIEPARFGRLDGRSRLVMLGLCILMGLAASLPAHAGKQSIGLDILVIHATKGTKQIDSRIRSLAESFSSLEFSSYKLLDSISTSLKVGASRRVELPNGKWMKVAIKSVNAGAVRLEIHSKRPKFKTTVSVKPRATIAVGGPAYQSGALIFAITPKDVSQP